LPLPSTPWPTTTSEPVGALGSCPKAFAEPEGEAGPDGTAAEPLLRPDCVPPAARPDVEADGEADEGDGAWDDECGPGEESCVEGVTLLGELCGMCPPACGPHAVSTAPATAAVTAAAVTPLILADATDLPPSAPLGARIGAGTGHADAQAGLSAGAPPVDGTAASMVGIRWRSTSLCVSAQGLPVAPSAPGVGQAAGSIARPRIPVVDGDGQYIRFATDVRPQ
jgi:hypothetical protein